MRNTTFNWAAVLGATLCFCGTTVQAADFAEDFESGGLDPSRFQLQVSEGVLEGGKVRLSASSDDGDWTNSVLNLAEYSDYVEAELTLLSGVSLPGARAGVGPRVETVAFNSSAEGGTEGRLGDVRIQLEFAVSGRGERAINYCLQRSLDTDFNESEPVMAGGDRCRSFPLLVEYNRSYRVAIAVDRGAKTVRFRVDGHSALVSIDGEMFTASRPRAQIDLLADRHGSGQALVDNVRTAPNELTDSERTAGLSAVPAFPAPPTAESLLADSTIENPYDSLSPVAFLDDFSDLHSTALAYEHNTNGNELPQSSVQYVGGAVQITSHSPDGEYSSGSISVHDNNSDSLSARVSLSSESSLPVDGDSRARIRIEATLFNDTFESANSREGDVRFNLGLRLRGDGRFYVSYWASRRGADGESEDLELGDISGFEVFDEMLLALDTAYDVSIELDRARRVVVMSVDQTSVEYPLSNIYPPYQSERSIGVQHEGSSGRAVGRLHSLTTAELDIDFADSVPVIAPLRPQWDAMNAGSTIEWGDERLTLTVDGAQEGRGQATVASRHRNDFLGADLELSSSSRAVAGEKNIFGVGATLFNDTAANTRVDNNAEEGDSFARVSLEDSGDEGLYAVYCYWRYDGEGWVEQVSGSTDDCDNRFNAAIAYDTPYAVSVALDRDSQQLLWSLNTETRQHALSAGIHDTSASYYRVQLRAGGSGLAVGHLDNLRFGPDAPALAESPDRLLIAPTEVSPGGSTTTSGGGGGGGGGSTHPVLLLIIAGSMVGRRMKKFRIVRLTGTLLAVVLSGCASAPQYTVAQSPVTPMTELDLSKLVRVHIRDGAKGEDSSFVEEALPGGGRSGTASDGCRWTKMELFSPAESWDGCAHPKAEWRSGRSDNVRSAGEAWPLEVGNKFSYSYSSVNANGVIGGEQVRKCVVLEPVHLALAIGEMDAYRVQCRDSGKGNWWTKRTWFLNSNHGVIKAKRVHSSRGVVEDWEVLRFEEM